MARPRRAAHRGLGCGTGLVEELAQTSTSVLGASVVAQRAAQAGLAVKSEWMSKVRSIDRANKATIQEHAVHRVL